MKVLHDFYCITLVNLRFADKNHVRGIDIDEVFEVEEVSEETLDVPGNGKEVIESCVCFCFNI